MEPDTGPAGDAVVDLVSHACPAPVARDVAVTPDAGLTPTPWLGQAATIAREHPTDGTARLTGSLTNVDSVLVEVDDACFGAGPVALDVTVDGPTEVRFSDGRPSVLLEPA